ncbi:MAG: hypothetical protein HYV03_08550 [Deltaproteobacteria bacterium]|nr:hypothetical protein [Deltaproteobacteria bacterium]
MHPLPKPVKGVFARWGRRGGQTRARRLSPLRRSTIAAQAARARWRGTEAEHSLPSVRLVAANWEDPVYLEEVLAEGLLADWRTLYQRIADYPFGATAEALARVLVAQAIYGATPLWKGILRHLQEGGR